MIPDTEEPLDLLATISFLLVVLLALTCSVRSKRPEAPAAGTEATLRVEVENRNFYDANVTVFCNGAREGRLSQVTGNAGAQRSFTVPDSCQNVRFTVELIGPRSRYTSPSIALSLPATLLVFVGHSKDLTFTTYEIH